jgi:peptidoglycan-associated lipoprotein
MQSAKLILSQHPGAKSCACAAQPSLLLGPLIIVSIALLCGCPNKKPVAAAQPATPPPPAPTASIQVAPATVKAGQSVTISWHTDNAADVAIDPIGAVQPNGSETVTPTESTTYHLTAKGPGGVQESVARVTVVAAAANSTMSEEDILSESSSRLDVFFDTDDYSIRADQIATIKTDAQFMKDHSDLNIVIEGHCDEMGSTEYNLALGDRRASEVRAALEKAGVASARMKTISYGKERPFCTEQNENCWRSNRRAHVAPDVQR